MNIANFMNIYTNIYIYITYIYVYIYIYIYTRILYATRITQNKNDLINPILQHGRVVDKNCCVVFFTSGFPYLILYPRQCKWKVVTTYLSTRTKNN